MGRAHEDAPGVAIGGELDRDLGVHRPIPRQARTCCTAMTLSAQQAEMLAHRQRQETFPLISRLRRRCSLPAIEELCATTDAPEEPFGQRQNTPAEQPAPPRGNRRRSRTPGRAGNANGVRIARLDSGAGLRERFGFTPCTWSGSVPGSGFLPLSYLHEAV